MRRLPSYLQASWAEQAGRLIYDATEPEFVHLTEFLEKRSAIANTRYGKLVGSRPDGEKDLKLKPREKFASSSARVTTLATHNEEYYKPKYKSEPPTTRNSERWSRPGENNFNCTFCHGTHELQRCRKFSYKTFQEKKDFVCENKLCYCCLKANPPHVVRNCQSGWFCPITGCGRRHHPLLHPTPNQTSWTGPSYRQTVSSAASNQPVKNVHTNGTSDTSPESRQPNGAGSKARCGAVTINQPRVSLQVIPVRVCGQDGETEIETYAFLDSGSDSTLCLNSLVTKLGIKGKRTTYTLSTLNGERQKDGMEVNLDVKGLKSNAGVRLDKVWTTDTLPISQNSIPTNNDAKQWPHLDGINLPELEDKEVTILIGNDVPEAHWSLEEKRGKRKQPYGVRTLLGWTLIGPINGEKTGGSHINCISIDQTINCDSPVQRLEPITCQLQRMYNADFSESLVDGRECMSMEDKRA